MRINNVEYPNVSIRVIESKRVVGLTGPKVVHRYEASVKRGAATQKRASEGRWPNAVSVTVNARKQTA